MAASTAFKNNLLDCIGTASTTITQSTYVALHTADPTGTGTGEVTTGSAARVLVENDGATSPYWNAAVGNVLDNNGVITFPQGGGDAVCTHWGVWDASAVSTGNFLFGGSLGSQFTWDASTIPEFASGALDVSIG